MGVVNGVNGGAAENAMSDNSKNLASAVAVEGFRRLGQLLEAINCMITNREIGITTYSSTGVGHVIHKDSYLVLNITHKNHAADNIRSRALLVNQSKSGVETVCKRGSALRTAGIRRDDDAVLNVQVLTDPPQDGRLSIQVIYRHIEKSLDL